MEMEVNTTCLISYSQPAAIAGEYTAIAVAIEPKAPQTTAFKHFFAAIQKSSC